MAFLTASGLRIHPPDEAIARRIGKLETFLAAGFDAATPQELGARSYTTDGELVRQLRRVRLTITHCCLSQVQGRVVVAPRRG